MLNRDETASILILLFILFIVGSALWAWVNWLF